MKLDNYSFSGFQGCPLWYKTRIVDGWAPPHKSAALGFGGAVHVGLAEWYRSRNPDAVMEKMLEAWPENHPVDDYRDIMKAKKVLLEYMQKYIHESFTIVPGMIEIATALPTGMYLPCNNPLCGLYLSTVDIRDGEISRTDEHCEWCGSSRELIEYGGIFDTLVDFAGQIYILEHKTTSQLGPRFFDQSLRRGHRQRDRCVQGRCYPLRASHHHAQPVGDQRLVERLVGGSVHTPTLHTHWSVAEA
jgi:hypothetical protein